MPRCWIALGGNQGRVSETFQRALSLLNESDDVDVVGVSQNYTTSPVGTVAGGQFLNAAAELRTSDSPLELLTRLQAVETALGRTRELHWGPRTLDLDLLFYGDQGEMILRSPTLILPHPHLWYRRFVLDPLLEIAPDLRHPLLGLSISDLVQRLEARPVTCTLNGGDTAVRQALRERASRAFPATCWLTSSAGDGVLSFWLGTASPDEALASHSRINLLDFPTPPWESLRDVLTAALDSTRRVNAPSQRPESTPG